MKWVVKVGAGEPSDPKPKCETAGRMVEWLKLLCLGDAVEMRAIRVSRHGTDVKHTERATYPTTAEGLLRMARDARELSPRAEGVYFTLNPVREDLADYATDGDVVSRTWLLVDVDPVRPSDASATDDEKQFAMMLGCSLRSDLEAIGVRPTIVADSGNGLHILYRIDLPTDDAGLVRRVLKALAAKYDCSGATIDVKVCNPSRICKLYGTIARKGPYTKERPHRTSVVLEAYPYEIVPREALDLIAGWLPDETPKAASPTKPSRWVRTVVDECSPTHAHAVAALDAESATMEATGAGTRNEQLFKSAAALLELVNAGSLDWSTVESRLTAAAKTAGLGDKEIATTLASARRKTEGKARDLTHVGKKSSPKQVVVDKVTGLIEPVDDERRLARLYLRQRQRHDDRVTLCYWNGDWHEWSEGAWRIAPKEEIEDDVKVVIKAEYERVAIETGEKLRSLRTSATANVMAMLRSLVAIRMKDVARQPHWFDVYGPEPTECLNFRNGILHLPTLIDDGPDKALTLPTPRYFTPTALPYDFDPSPSRPDHWFAFLDSIWGEDPESIAALQQWFGYLLTPDTSYQAILMITGPPRSGKGTILRTLLSLLGNSSVVAPTLTSLGTHFGCEDLIGKSLAYFGESRISGRSDTQAIVERLLSISGEDEQSIPRKNQINWKGRLPTRFVMLANEVPRLGDVSNALMSRLIILKLTKSFVGKEDRDLESKLAPELPGILFWAIEGWESLLRHRRFLQPSSGEAERKEMGELNNPIGQFVDEHMEIGVEYRVPRGDLFAAWLEWCKANNRTNPGDAPGFYRNLRTHLRNQGIELGESQPRINGKKTRVFSGVRLVNEFADVAED